MRNCFRSLAVIQVNPGSSEVIKIAPEAKTSAVDAFLDATNVDGQHGVMHELTFVFREDGFDQTSVYQTPDGALDTSTLHFVRE